VSFYTSFVSAVISAWPDNVGSPSLSVASQQIIAPAQLNIITHKMEQFELDSAGTRMISLANYVSTEWSFIIMKVIGNAYISTAGFDTNGSTAITAKLPAYGTALLPGIAIFSSYNVSTFSVISLADDTTIELYAAISCADDDARIL